MRVLLAGATVVALVAAVFVVRPNLVARVDDKVCDLLTGSVRRGNLSGRVAIVEIDEASLEQFGRWPWPRDLLGRLVGRILEHGAATVVLDMILREEDRGSPSSLPAGVDANHELRTNDDVFAAAITGRPVVIGYAFQFDGSDSAAPVCALQSLPLTVVGPNESWQTGFFHASSVRCSIPKITAAAAGNGFLNAAPDSDGNLRRIPLIMEYRDRQYSSLALAAFTVYRRASSAQLDLNDREASRLTVGAQGIPLEGPGTMRLRFRGARRTFPYVAASSILNGQPANTLQGKIVIVGGSALGLPTAMATPVDALLPDVEIEATAIDNLLRNDPFHRPAGLRLWELVIALSAGMAATIAPLRIRASWSALIGPIFVVGTWAACVLLLSRTGLLLSPFPATAALASVLPVVTILNYVLEKRRAERAEGKLAEAEERGREVVRESESRYERLVENVNDAIIMTDAEGRLVFANRRFREWFGLQDTNPREVAPENFVAPEWRAALRDQHQRWMRGETAANEYEYEALRPDGTRIWIEALVTGIEENGRIVGTQAALRDVTERKRMEAQFLQAQKMESIGRLAGIVAHDFNNLLTVINGYCDLLLKTVHEEHESSALGEIRAAGERAADLTRNLLAFSRKQRVQPRTLDLNTIVAGAEKMFRRLIGEDIELVTRLSPALGHVRADAGQLHQILMNLLVNARDAMPSGGSVVIQTRNVLADEDFLRQHRDFERGAYVYLGVTDSGTGMSQEVKRHLFEPFYTTKEPGKGTGLGLATVFGIV